MEQICANRICVYSYTLPPSRTKPDSRPVNYAKIILYRRDAAKGQRGRAELQVKGYGYIVPPPI